MKFNHIALAFAAVSATGATVFAHNGRRFEIKVVDDQIVTQGYISDGVDDGGGVVRPYYNALHGHWENLPTANAAAADLPGYDLFDPGPLVGGDLMWTLTGAMKWVDPPVDPTPGTVPTFEALTLEETIYVGFGGTTIDTASGGSLTLVTSISASGADDIDFSYDIALQPSNTLYVLESTLSSSAGGVSPSGTIYTILSPQGADAIEKMHLASLYLEGYFGTPVPEPASLGLLGLTGVLLMRRRKGAA